MLVSLLFEHMLRRKRLKFFHEKKKLNELLMRMPDFYLEMKWDFDSSILPLVSKLAPSGDNAIQYKA